MSRESLTAAESHRDGQRRDGHKKGRRPRLKTGVADGLKIFGWHCSAGRKRRLTYTTGINLVVVVFHIVRVLIHIR
ncbi:hypothetical protein M2428_004026 [Arthrobacter sp. ES3-54]|nr:hypothetical protein [Arthrobacter sp. ES3-54]